MIRFVMTALLLVFGLGGLVGDPTPARGQPAPDAGVMIRYPDGHVESLCVDIPPGGITGLEVLQQAGVPLRVESQSGGVTVCAIRGQGCPDPTTPCFCQCQGGGDCLFWTYYHWLNGRWVAATLGASNTTARPGTVEGWGWGAPPPAPTGAALCGVAAPAPSPTVPPPAFTPTPRPPAAPTRRPAPTPTRARPPPPPSATALSPTLAPPPLSPTEIPSPSSPPASTTATPRPPAPPTPTETPTAAPPTVSLASATPTAARTTPVPSPTSTPQPLTPNPGPDLAGLLAFAAIVGVLLGAMGWLRWRNRGL